MLLNLTEQRWFVIPDTATAALDEVRVKTTLTPTATITMIPHLETIITTTALRYHPTLIKH